MVAEAIHSKQATRSSDVQVQGITQQGCDSWGESVGAKCAGAQPAALSDFLATGGASRANGAAQQATGASGPAAEPRAKPAKRKPAAEVGEGEAAGRKKKKAPRHEVAGAEGQGADAAHAGKKRKQAAQPEGAAGAAGHGHARAVDRGAGAGHASAGERKRKGGGSESGVKQKKMRKGADAA